MSDPATHAYRRPIHFADTDAAGVAHFSRLLVIVEEAIHNFFESREVPILDGASAWPFVSVHADYSAGCRFQDEITVALSVDQIGTSSVAFSFTAKKADGTSCFGGTATLCYIDPSRNAPASIPAKTRNALDAGPVSS